MPAFRASEISTKIDYHSRPVLANGLITRLMHQQQCCSICIHFNSLAITNPIGLANVSRFLIEFYDIFQRCTVQKIDGLFTEFSLYMQTNGDGGTFLTNCYI